MSFWNTVASAILIAVILELVRHTVGRITKKSDLLKEYRLELVRKRLGAYEKTYMLLESYSYLFLVNIEGKEQKNFFFDKFAEMAKSILQNTFYFSSETEQLIHNIHSLLFQKATFDMDKKTAGNFRQELLSLLNQLIQKMKEEIYSAKIERWWAKAVAQVPNIMTSQR